MSIVLSAREVSVRQQGVYRVNRVSLEVAQGEIFGLLGAPGAGKTALLRLLAGLDRPTEGEVLLFGQPMGRPGDVPVAAVLSPGTAPGRRTGRELARLATVGKGQNRPTAQWVLALAGLDGTADVPAAKLPAVLRRQLDISLALVAAPRLLVLDEPTLDLTQGDAKALDAWLQELPGQTGVTILLSSRSAAEIERTAAIAGLLRRGRLLCQGAPGDLAGPDATVLRFASADGAYRAQAVLAARGYRPVPANRALVLNHLSREQAAQVWWLLAQAGTGALGIEPMGRGLLRAALGVQDAAS